MSRAAGKRWKTKIPSLAALLAAAGCARGAASVQKSGPEHDAGGTAITIADASARVEAPRAATAPDAGSAATTIDLDGDDDPEDPGTGAVPASGRWEKVGTPPLALTRICDLTPFAGSLYAAHANQPLGTDGATITRYSPDDPKRPFRVAFDWNRPGEPAKGGGAGQGFLRVHATGGRLFVPDADPPYGGLQQVDRGTEGYVFVSDPKGAFAPPRAPHFRPPGPPDLRGARAGAGVLPRAYHVLDTIRYRGALYASTGSVPPKEQAWRGPSPGALHRASEDGARWTYEVDYPFPWQNGVWRLTFLVRFRDRLYAGIQDYDHRDPNDFLRIAPEASDAGPTTLRREDIHPVRVTRGGGSATLRWWADTRVTPHRLYWLAWTREGVTLRMTIDGDRWAIVPLPEEAGRPTDITRFKDGVVVLTENGLYELGGASIDGRAGLEMISDVSARLVAANVDESVPPKKRKSPFELSDFMCAAPLAVLDGALYAGGQRGGTIYRLTTE